ncbi:MAG: glycosyltransferase [Oribacterium sp.]|nr:glycosyltransferase [Oribacterium sp.]
MKVLHLNIKTFFANMDMLEAFEQYRDSNGCPLEIIKYDYKYDPDKARNDPDFEERFFNDLRKYRPDFVFSFNFLPVISKVCNKEGIIYVSWIYDNPEIFLYNYNMKNPCNIVLMFDSKQYMEFMEGGIKNVHYLPLAASTKRLDSIIPTGTDKKKYSADISFVGSLYTERKQYYEEIAPKLDPYTLGYIDGIINSQLQVDGVNFVEECLTPDITQKIQKASNIYPYPDSIETLEYLYANYIINRQITIIERKELLTLIGAHHPLKLYTYKQNNSFSPKGVHNMGPANYFTEMPLVFKLSKINLNITLRSIQHAIPLRVFDILGSGGFLLSNFQRDLQYHFVPGEDFVYYESRKDLLDKIDYYLVNENERMDIARNAHRKIKEQHTFNVRVKEIIDLVKVHTLSPSS